MDFWIDEKMAAYRKARKNLEAVAASADMIFGQLWGEIEAIIEGISNRGMQLETNGSPRNRVLIMGLPPHGSERDQRRRLNLALASAPGAVTITAKSDADETIFNIEVGSDDIVCLKKQGHELTIQEAARAVMEPFLFSGKSPYCVANVGVRLQGGQSE
jgi:hypothetical protein